MSGARRHANGAAGPPTSMVGSREYFVEVLTDWFANRKERTSEHITPEEIGACENRVILLLQAMAIGIVSIYRDALFSTDATDSADERSRGALYMMGVFVSDTYFSNNEKGCSTASASRVAELLGCSVNSVLRARARLVEQRILAGGRKDGHGDRWWPVINRKVAADPKASGTWLLDATSAPVKRGRPAKIYAPDGGREFANKSTPPMRGGDFPAKKSTPPKPKSTPPELKSTPRTRGDETKTETDFSDARARETRSSPQKSQPSADEVAFAERNIWVTNLGDLEIGPELLGHLTGTKGFTEEEIHLALPRALQRAGDDRSPVRLLGAIHEQLSYLRQDTAKRRGKVSKEKPAPSAAPTGPPPDLDERTRAFHAALLQGRVTPAVYHEWFADVVVKNLVGGKLIVTAATPFRKTYIAARYSNQMQDAATAAFGVQNVLVEFAR